MTYYTIPGKNVKLLSFLQGTGLPMKGEAGTLLSELSAFVFKLDDFLFA